MIKKIFSLAVLFSTPMFSQVVKDTIWVDSFDYIVAKKDAESFKIAKTIKGNTTLKSIEVYNATTKKIESKGNGIFQEGGGTALYNGDVVYYDKEGKVNATYTYDDNHAITKAVTIDPRNGTKYTGAYVENNLYNGIAFYVWKGTYIYVEAEDGISVNYQIINPNNDKNILVYEFDENNGLVGEKYYDENGVLKHEGTYESSTIYNGTSTLLDYNDFKLLSNTVYTEGTAISTTSYYKSGKVKSTSVLTDNVTKEEYFDQNGKKLGTYTSTLQDDGYSTYQNGVNYYFNMYDGNPDDIYAIHYYKDNVALKIEEYYTSPDKNTIKSISYYKEDNTTQKIEYFYENGSPKGQIIYDENGYSPKDGTLYEGTVKSIYKNGKLIEKTDTYTNGQVFESMKNNVATYYDIKGKELGKVTYKEEPLYNTTTYISGTRYSMAYDLITGITKYDKEVTTYDATFETTSGVSVMSTETYYQDSNLTKEVEYYSNGKKAKESIYNPNTYTYSPVKAIYYDKTGKDLGTYDYITNTGTLVEFSYNKDITSIEKFNQGIPISKKGYALRQDGISFAPSTYYLQSDIDYNKQGKFYNEKGEMIASATYKNTLPYNGKVHIIDSYYNTESEYKNGEKVGKEIIKYAHGDEVISINHYESNQLTKSELYENNTLKSVAEYQDNVLHGPTTYYDADGEVLSTLIYSEGYPLNGTSTEVSYEHFTTQTYEEGKLINKKSYTTDDLSTPKTLVCEETYGEDNAIYRVINNEETGALLFKYNLLNDQLNGLYQYFENGKVKYQATLKEGVLVDGTIAVLDFNHDPYSYSLYDTEVSKHTVLSNKKGTYTLSILNKESKEIFKMETKVKKGDASLNPLSNKKITLDNIYPTNQFNVVPYNYGYDYAVDAAADAATAAASATAEEVYYE